MPLPIYSPPDNGDIGGSPPPTSTAGPVLTVNGEVGDVVINAASLGLGSVNNTSDADKPVSTSQAAAISSAQAAATAAASSAAVAAAEAALGPQIDAISAQVSGGGILD